jgi:hypothetical protein
MDQSGKHLNDQAHNCCFGHVTFEDKSCGTSGAEQSPNCHFSGSEQKPTSKHFLTKHRKL